MHFERHFVAFPIHFNTVWVSIKLTCSDHYKWMLKHYVHVNSLSGYFSWLYNNKSVQIMAFWKRLNSPERHPTHQIQKMGLVQWEEAHTEHVTGQTLRSTLSRGPLAAAAGLRSSCIKYLTETCLAESSLTSLLNTRLTLRKTDWLTGSMKEKKVVCELGVPPCYLMKGSRKKIDRGRVHCDLINAPVKVLQSHHTTFGGFDVKGSGLGHTIINGNPREPVTAWCVVEEWDCGNNSVRTRNLLDASPCWFAERVYAVWMCKWFPLLQENYGLISVSESGDHTI